MAYRLKQGESVPDGIKRIVTEEIDSAAEGLQNCGLKDRDAAIHEARKSLKKIRGALRLVRSDLGDTYRNENSRFRDVGRRLSELRDAQAVLEVFHTVVRRHQGSLRKSAVTALRRGIESTKREKQQSIDMTGLMQTAIGAFRAARERVAGWPLRNDGFAALAPGLKLAYRRGRSSLVNAQSNPDPALYHEFRKRVKDHWYHVRLLESVWTEVQQARESSLHDLETWLGDDHNLVVLCAQVQKSPDRYGVRHEVQLFLSLAAQYQKELRDNSVALGHRLYEEKPRPFVRRMEKLWDVWQQDPKSMRQVQKDRRSPPKKQPGRAPATKVVVAGKATVA
jgi:CHAD domain-containing protein